MPWMPGASRVQTFSGNRHRATISKIVLHTTEGSNWPGYGGGGSAPHFTVHRDGTIRQHISTDQSSKALVNRSGGVQTNNAGVVQIEFIGSCDRSYANKHGLFFTENATDKDLAGLARVVKWISQTHGIPLTVSGLSWPTTNAAYATAPQRLSYSRWNSYRGVLGHTHVPENDHWDPGNFPVSRLLKLAGGASVPSGGSSSPGSAGKPWTTSPRVNGMTTAEVKEIQQVLLGFDLDLGKWGADGKYGDATGNAVKTLQTELNITSDGIYGPSTQEAVMTIRSDVDRIKAIVTQNQKEIRRVPGKVLNEPVALEGDWEGQTGTLAGIRAWYAHDIRQIKTAIGKAETAIVTAVQQTGKAQGLTDDVVQKIADAAAEAAAGVSAEDVADRLDVTVREQD